MKSGARNTMLEVTHLATRRGDRTLWTGLNFSISSGTLLYVLGANGSGKTTLLATLAGLVEPQQGEIFWRRTVVARSPGYRRQMAYLAHNNGLNGDIGVSKNLEYAANLAGNIDAARVAETVNQALVAVGMEKHGARALRHLSQGQQRRVAVARMLLQRARLWLLDEPFTALDDESIDHFRRLLSNHLTNGGLAAISSHQVISINAPHVDTLRL
jgi:heme exporter protein A